MPAPDELLYWVECQEAYCLWRTPRFAEPREAVEAFHAHEAAHPGKTTRTISYADSVKWVTVGGRVEDYRVARQITLFGGATAPTDDEIGGEEEIEDEALMDD